MKRSLVILCVALALNLQAASMDDMINKGVKIAKMCIRDRLVPKDVIHDAAMDKSICDV